MKLCIDCKHFMPDTTTWSTPYLSERYATCALTARVTGKDGYMCKTRRDAPWLLDACGKNGRLWEPK